MAKIIEKGLFTEKDLEELNTVLKRKYPYLSKWYL